MKREELETILATLGGSDDIVMCEVVSIPRSEEPPTELRVAPAGRFEGHPAGPFTIDAEFAATVERNRKEMSFRPPIDERHRTGIPFLSAPRLGTVGRYEFRDDGLYACEMDWNERGTNSYKADEYGYVSIGFKPNVNHPKTKKPMGPFMTHLACTNVPFFGGASTALAELAGGSSSMKIEDIIAELKGDSTKAAAVEAAMRAEKPGLNITAEASVPVDAELREVICAEYGLGEDADVTAIKEAVATRKETRAQSIVASAVAAGKVPKDKESELHKSTLAMAKANPEQTEQFLASMPASVPGPAAKPPAERKEAATGDDGEPVELDDEQKSVNAEFGLSDEDFEKYSAAGE